MYGLRWREEERSCIVGRRYHIDLMRLEFWAGMDQRYNLRMEQSGIQPDGRNLNGAWGRARILHSPLGEPTRCTVSPTLSLRLPKKFLAPSLNPSLWKLAPTSFELVPLARYSPDPAAPPTEISYPPARRLMPELLFGTGGVELAAGSCVEKEFPASDAALDTPLGAA